MFTSRRVTHNDDNQFTCITLTIGGTYLHNALDAAFYTGPYEMVNNLTILSKSIITVYSSDIQKVASEGCRFNISPSPLLSP